MKQVPTPNISTGRLVERLVSIPVFGHRPLVRGNLGSKLKN
jgi:hypothetical protein